MPKRLPAVAGMFYEADPEALRAQVRRCFERPPGPGSLPGVDERGPRSIAGLVAPHAGLMYSGYAAAHAYAHLAHDGPVDVAAILCPNHRGVGSGSALWSEGEWETPLGAVPVAADVAADLRSRCPWIEEDTLAHRYEHAIEVQLPFLQVLYGRRVSLLPIAMRQCDVAECVELGGALAAALRGRNAVVIASCDFSHYVPAARAREQDAYALEAVERLDPEELFRRIHERRITACGCGPIAAMLAAARRMGAQRAETLAYTTSGDITGDQAQVVGYAAVKVTR